MEYSFWLGEEGDDSPRVSVNFDFGDYLPDEETELCEGGFDLAKLPEESPGDYGPLVIDEADYGDE